MKKLECILLIDDNANDNYYHFIILRDVVATKEVKTVRDGNEALQFLQTAKEYPEKHLFPDLIFLDINMPGMNGFEFLAEIRKQKLFVNRKPVVIIMTNFLNEENEQQARKQFGGEIVAFAKKPLTAELLNEIIANHFA